MRLSSPSYALHYTTKCQLTSESLQVVVYILIFTLLCIVFLRNALRRAIIFSLFFLVLFIFNISSIYLNNSLLVLVLIQALRPSLEIRIHTAITGVIIFILFIFIVYILLWAIVLLQEESVVIYRMIILQIDRNQYLRGIRNDNSFIILRLYGMLILFLSVVYLQILFLLDDSWLLV